jgi:hypothetical protein
MKAFCFPAGEDAARSVRGIRTVQRGELRNSPAARWMPFMAEETVSATASSFRWEARFAGGSLKVTDAFENGSGRLVMSLGGLVPVKKFDGPDVDHAELQRYLSYIAVCPPMLLNHGSLEFTEGGEATVGVGDRRDSGARIVVDIDSDGRPVACRADRPRLQGKQSIPTPWRAAAGEWRNFDGFRAATHLEAAWVLHGEEFVYFRADMTSLAIIRPSAPSS